MVSIITPVWNHAEITQQFIQGIATTSDIDFELVIVDNASDDNTSQMLEQYKNYPWLKVIKNKENLGFGGGNNVGYKASKGDVLLFMNNDIVIENPNWLRNLLEVYKQNPKSIVGAQKVEGNDFTRIRGKTNAYINGWCMLLSRELCEKIGGFDENFGLGWFEDVWFSVRAQQLGYKLIEAKIPIRHLGSSTIMDGKLNHNELMSRAGSYYRYRVIRSSIPKGKMRIVFLCQGNYKFSDKTWEGRGVGGAEASLILLTRELSKLGHVVDVYNDPDVAGRQNGVNYFPLEDFNYSDYSDVCIIFRNAILDIEKINSAYKIFWSCDQFTNADYNQFVFPMVDRIICISDFHKKYFLRNYLIEEEKIGVIDLGVNLPDYEKSLPKIHGKMIFCSVPHRGLAKLLELYPRIKEKVPHAQLVITSDYSLWGGDPDNDSYMQTAEQMDGVKFLGKVDRDVLVREQLESEIMAYPCIYPENFCISAAECLAAGTIPVYFNKGALGTTIGMAGFEVMNDTDFVEKIVELFTEPKALFGTAQLAKTIAKVRFNYKEIALKWEKLLWNNSRAKMIDLVDHLKPFNYLDLDILDLGCGKMESGISSQIPHLKFKSYHGVDIWDKDLAVGSNMRFATKDISFERADIIDWVEKQGKKEYDVTFLFDVIEHLDKDQAKKFLKKVEGLTKKRILIFMPIGDHTLEANDGVVIESNNPYQKHLSEWSVAEWKELGYDVELLEGFHHDGILDAAWIIKDMLDKPIKCSHCGLEFNSKFFYDKHRLAEENPLEVVAPSGQRPMPPILLKTKRVVELSLPNIDTHGQGVKEILVPYDQVSDVARILHEAYGDDIIDSQELEE